jgi:sec-independent protein translocase protein TatA
MTFLPILAWSPSLPELIVILVVVLIFFGPKRLPGLSRAIGKSISEFKRGKDEAVKELHEGRDEADADKK